MTIIMMSSNRLPLKVVSLLLLLLLSLLSLVHGQQLTFSAFGICAVGSDGKGYCDSSAGTDPGSIGGGPAINFSPPDNDPFVQITQDTIHGICGLTASGVYSCATGTVPSGPYTFIASLPEASNGGTPSPGTAVLDSTGKMIGIGQTAWVSLVDSLSAIKFTQILTVDTALYGVASDGHIECLNIETMVSCTGDIKGTTLNYALVATDVNQELCGIGFDSSWSCADVSSSKYTTTRPIPPVSINEVIQLTIGGKGDQNSGITPFSCILFVNHTVQCWGFDTSLLDLTNVIQISSSANLAYYSTSDPGGGMINNGVGGLCLVHTDASMECNPGLNGMPNAAGGLAPQFKYRLGNQLLDCPLGRFSTGVGAVTPLCSGPCGIGYYGNTTGTSKDATCNGLCPPGTQCSAYGTGQPPPCSVGFYCPTGATTFACPPGTMCEATGNIFPPPCSQYHYCPTSTDIEPCPLGRYSSGTGAYNDSCSGLCQPGYFGNVSTVATPLCVGQCPLGTLCLNPGTIQPEPCPLGFWCPTAFTLNPCPNGTYGAHESLIHPSDCALCPANTANPFLNATDPSFCGLCAIGQGSLAGADVCFPCPQDTFSDTVGGGCTPCQSEGCQGGPNCKLGYVGGLCSACAGGFYEGSDSSTAGANLQCLQCGTTPIWAIILLLFIFLIFASVFMKLNASPVFRAVLVPITVGTPFIQISSFMRLINFKWSQTTVQTMQTVGVINLDLNQLQCFVSFQSTFTFILMSPILLVSFLLFGGLIMKCILSINSKTLNEKLVKALDLEETDAAPKDAGAVVPQSSNSLSESLLTPSQDASADISVSVYAEMPSDDFRAVVWEKFMDTGRKGFISFCSFAYMFLCWQCLVIFDCENVAGSGIRVRENVTIECYTGQWSNYLLGSIAGIFVYMIGIPAGFLFIIYRRSSIAGDLLGAALTFLRPSMRWWLVGQIFWNLAMVMVLRLLLEHTTAQVVLFSLLLVFRITISIGFHPYVDRMHNREEEILAGLAGLILVFGLIFFAGNLNSTLDRVLFVFTVFAIIGMGVTVGYYIYWTYKIEKKKLHDAKALEPLEESSTSTLMRPAPVDHNGARSNSLEDDDVGPTLTSSYARGSLPRSVGHGTGKSLANSFSIDNSALRQ